MKISASNHFLQSRHVLLERNQPPQKTKLADGNVKPESDQVSLSAEARQKSERSIALAKEQLSIVVEGKKVAPQDRTPLIGFDASQLQEMSDSEYQAALENESAKLGSEASTLYKKVMSLVFPQQAARYIGSDQKPEMTVEEAKTTLSGYASSLSDSIKARNQFQTYLSSEKTFAYLVERYGENEAKAELERTRGIIDDFDRAIGDNLTSLRIVFGIDPDRVISRKEDLLSMNTVKGEYTGSSDTYKFTVRPDGSIDG